MDGSDNLISQSPHIIIDSGAVFQASIAPGGEFTLTHGQTLSGIGEFEGELFVASGSEVSPGLSPGQLSVESLEFKTGSILNIELNGVTAGTDYDQISTDFIDLDDDSNGGATLEISLGYVPAINDSFIIIELSDVFPISNHFYNLPEGTSFSADETLYSITYEGGDGNDVVLTVIGASRLYVDQNVAVAGDGSSLSLIHI